MNPIGTAIESSSSVARRTSRLVRPGPSSSPAAASRAATSSGPPKYSSVCVPRLRAWLSHPQAIAIMKLTGSTQVMSQMMPPPSMPKKALRRQWPSRSFWVVGAPRKPPKTSIM